MNAMTASSVALRAGLLSAAVALAMPSPQAFAQQMDHSKMNMPMPATKPAPPRKKPVAMKPAAKPAAPAMDHSKMQMPMPAAKPAPAKPAVRNRTTAKPAVKSVPKRAATTAKPAAVMDHSRMPMPATQPGTVDPTPMAHDMAMPAAQGAMEGMDHSKMAMPADPSSAQGMDHSAMGDMPGMTMAPTDPLTPIPLLTDADRAAAAPPPAGHAVHDNSIQSFVLVDRLEAWNADHRTGTAWEALAWVGTDLNRLWLRSEGERVDGRTESADLEVLYGRSVATWWDVVTGIRHDFKPGASQDFVALGVIGLAPQKFEVEATAYIGERGQTAARFEAEYDLLLTNRLILQPLVEANLYGKDDAKRGIGSGLGTIEAGLRLRYEFTREFAPYIGIVRERAFGGTADFRRAEGEDIDDTRLVAGFRFWF